MKIYSLTGLSLILASALSVLAQSQLAAFSSPKPSPQSQVTTTSPKPATPVPSPQSKTPPKSANNSPKANPPQNPPAKPIPTSTPQSQPANHSPKATPPQNSPAKPIPTSTPQSQPANPQTQPSSKLATSPQTGNPSPQTPTKGTGFQPVTHFSPPEATYIGRGKLETKVDVRHQRRDAELSTGLGAKTTFGANGGVFHGSGEGTLSKNGTSNTQECRSQSVKISTTPAMYQAPDGHIFKMIQPVKEEIRTDNPWTACPDK